VGIRQSVSTPPPPSVEIPVLPNQPDVVCLYRAGTAVTATAALRAVVTGLLVEARPKQGILLLLEPVPDVSRCSATHEALLQMKVMTIGQEGKPD